MTTTQRIGEPIDVSDSAASRQEKHLARSTALLAHADRYLNKSRMTAADRLQVSEKIWGSMTHTLKAIAASRGWQYRKARSIDSMIYYLRKHSNDPSINHLHSTVRDMHINFYEDRFPKQKLRDGVAAVKDLNERLWNAIENVPADAAPPSGMTKIEPRPQRKPLAPRSSSSNGNDVPQERVAGLM